MMTALLLRAPLTVLLAAWALVALWRAVFLYFANLDLIGDESYYWEWSRRLDWCYYSKPPLVAWLIALSTAIGGATTESVRWPAVIFGTWTLWPCYRLAQALYGHSAGVLAVLLLLAMPLSVLTSFLMTIDPPLYLSWWFALMYLHQALFGRQRRRDWIYAGVAMAFGLLSKPTALALPILTAAYLICESTHRQELTRGFLWLLPPCLLALLPQIWWNAQHDWIMLHHNQTHFSHEAASGLTHLQNFGEFSMQQALLISPLIWIGVLGVSLVLLMQWRWIEAKARWLLWMGPLPLWGVIGLALAQKVQGNWPAPFYFSGLVLLAGYIISPQSIEKYRYFIGSRYASTALAFGVIMVIATYLLPFSHTMLPSALQRIDPTNRLRQWRELAEQVQTVRLQQNLGDETALLVYGHRDIASELAFYLPDQPQVYLWSADVGVNNQYDLWPGLMEDQRQRVLLISQWRFDDLPSALRETCKIWHAVGVATLLPHSTRAKQLFIYLGNR